MCEAHCCTRQFSRQSANRGLSAGLACLPLGSLMCGGCDHKALRDMGYARTFFIGGTYAVPTLPDFGSALAHLHQVLADVARHLDTATELRSITPEMLLQGPFSDAMTHAGQLAMLRRLSGSPIPPENFVFAKIDPANLGPDQPFPASPDKAWPERP